MQIKRGRKHRTVKNKKKNRMKCYFIAEKIQLLTNVTPNFIQIKLDCLVWWHTS